MMIGWSANSLMAVARALDRLETLLHDNVQAPWKQERQLSKCTQETTERAL
jgi:hypothetical protein